MNLENLTLINTKKLNLETYQLMATIKFKRINIIMVNSRINNVKEKGNKYGQMDLSILAIGKITMHIIMEE